MGFIASLLVTLPGYALEFVGNPEFRGNPFALGGSGKTADVSTGVSGTSGAATASIPIVVPPGPGGLAPSLSLSYSSDQGDGPFGLGWSLALGEIRCTARFGVPNYAACPEFELDGQLLVGPDAQGRYHTKVESFRRILRMGIGSGVYWEVTAPGGTRFLYGETNDSKIASDGQAPPPAAPTARWLLSKIIDIHGNEIAIRYDRSDLGVAYPSTIAYASQKREVAFLYEDRPDKIFDYPGGIPRNITKRLHEIAITSVDEIFSRRLIRYSAPGDYATHRSRIISSQLFGKDCTDPDPAQNCPSLPAQTYEYTETTLTGSGDFWQMAPSGDWVESGIFVKTGAQTTSSDVGRRLADVNGDGLPDLVVGYCQGGAPCVDPAQGPVVYINDGSGWVQNDPWTHAIQSLTYEAPTVSVESTGYPDAAAGPNRRACNATTGTVTRRISFATDESDWHPIDVTGNFHTFTPWPSWHMVDVNGDGYADLVTSIRGGVVPIEFDCAGNPIDPEWVDNYDVLLGGAASQKIFLNNGTGWDPASAGMAESLPIFQTQTILKHAYDRDNFLRGFTGDCDGQGWLGYYDAIFGFNYYCTTFTDLRPQFVELNGDGLVDIIVVSSYYEPEYGYGDLWLDDHDATAFASTSRSEAWMQNADDSGWTRAPEYDPPTHIESNLIPLPAFSLQGAGGMQPYDTGVYFVDLNRDGLTDVVKGERHYSPSGTVSAGSVLINTGAGWCNDMGSWAPTDCDGDTSHSRYLPPIPFNEHIHDPSNGEPISQSNRLVFVDLNGDGWVDLLQGKGNPDVLKAWLHDPGAPALNSAGKPSVWVEQSGRFKPPTPFYPGTQFADLDGNGTADILHGWLLYGFGTSWTAQVAYLSPGTSSDLLASVDNGRGGITDFNYVSVVSQQDDALEMDARNHAAELGDVDGSSDAVTLFTPKPVVSGQTVSGVGIAADVTTRYRYARPRFDPIERVQLGFALVETTRPDRSSVDAYYDQREGLVGRPSAQETFDENGTRVHRSTEMWALAANPGGIPGAMEGVNVARMLSQTSFNVYAGENGPMQLRRFSYNDTYGYNFVASISDDRETGSLTTTFTPEEPANPAKWLVGLVDEMKQLSAGITYSREVYDYTSSGQVASRSRDIGLRDGTAASDIATTSWTYDAYGNATSQSETRGKDAAGNRLPSRTVEFCYDGDEGENPWCPSLPGGMTATHSLRVGVRDPIGGVVELEPDWVTGAVRQVGRFTESGGFRDSVSIVRDAFGRGTQKWFRGASFGGGESDVQLTEVTYHDSPVGNTPVYVEEFQFTGDVGGAPIRTARYLDGFGEPFRSVEETPSGFRGTAVFWNPITRTVRSVGPIACVLLDASCSGITATTEPFSEQELDAVGRVVRTTSPDGQVTTVYSRLLRAQMLGDGIQGVFDAIESLNSNGLMTRRVTDGDRVIWVDECLDISCFNKPDSTFYRYEPTGEIAAIYDAIATSTGDYASSARFLRYHYDTLGRIVQTDEPNTGSSFAEYDHQGNATSATNVRGMTTHTDYDPLGRVTAMDRPAGAGEWDLDFSYDPISRKRKSVTTPDSNYSDAWEYDDRGRLKRQTQSYYDRLVMDFDYDLLGRLTRVDYPSNHSSASYVYQGAYLKQVCHRDDFCVDTPENLLISDVQYDALGRRSDIATSKGTVHREYYAFDDDPTGRSVNSLKRLAITAGAAAGALDFDYQYDSVGNVTAIGDQSTTYDASASYTYDARNRLRSWRDANNVTRWYTYDMLGNLEGHGLASAGGANQVFDPVAKPHQLTRNRSGEEYAYDLDGNVTMRGSTFFVYNSANQLVCTGLSDGACDGPGYRYDADGQLLWDGAAGQQWMGDLFRWQAQGFVAYSNIFAFGEKIAELKQERIRLRVAGSALARLLPVPDRPFLWMIGSAGLFSLIALLACGRAGLALRETPATAMAALVLAGLLVVPPAAWGRGGRTRGTVTTLRVFFRDHLGSAAYVTGPDQRQAYEPFGKAILTAPGAEEEFTTKQYHRATGLHFFGARWYDAEAGRFAGVDPLVASPMDPQELNAYSYASNDPVNRVDPTGMFTMCTPSGRVCFGDGGRSYHSNVPGGFQPFAPSWTTPATGPVSAGLASTGAYSGSIAKRVVIDDDGYPWVYKSFKPETKPFQTGVGVPAAGGSGGFLRGVGNAVRGLGGILGGDLASTFTGLIGNAFGIVKGLVTSLYGLSTFDLATVKSGISDLGWSLIPRYGFFSGPGWGRPTDLGYSPFDNPIDHAARIHDEVATHPGADRQLIRNVWSGHNLGPVGQVYRVVLTAGFGARIGMGMDH